MNPYTPADFKLAEDYRFAGDPTSDIPPYLFTAAAVTAVKVALAVDRPLLVAGPPGCGKSRLAEATAAVLGWNFLARTMTSRTRLEEMTVEVDHLRRLHDAHRAAMPGAEALRPDEAYHNPGIFWWAFNPASARRRGLAKVDAARHGVDLRFPGTRRIRAGQAQCTVLLIDEIDKAEPDVPNDLLEPLDRRSFSLPGGATVSAAKDQKLLTVITTNRERELPPAFLRRCVSLVFEDPDRDDLIDIAGAHYPTAHPDRVAAIADAIIACREDARTKDHRPPGTSEFLDTIRACEELQVEVTDRDLWGQIIRAVLMKPKD